MFYLHFICRELLEIIREVGKKLMETAPSETVVGNITRRVLKIVRDEYARGGNNNVHSEQQQQQPQPDSDLQESLQKILTADEAELDYTKTIPSLIQAIMEEMGEFMAELEGR